LISCAAVMMRNVFNSGRHLLCLFFRLGLVLGVWGHGIGWQPALFGRRGGGNYVRVRRDASSSVDNHYLLAAHIR